MFSIACAENIKLKDQQMMKDPTNTNTTTTPTNGMRMTGEQKKNNDKENTSSEEERHDHDGDDDLFKGEFSPNFPHPLIEYPPLYFILKSSPRVMNALRKIYAFRWELHYPLQQRVPFNKKLRKIGITATWGELLLWMPFAIILSFGIVYSFIYPSMHKSGIVARVPLFICFLTANHNSLLTLILGIPFERAIKYHKVSGYLAFITGIFHTSVVYLAHYPHYQKIHKHSAFLSFSYNGQANSSGTILLTIILGIIITANPFVRRKAFEVFFYFHICFAISIMGCAFYHSGVLVPVIATLLWGVDLIIRKLFMALHRYPREASIECITDAIVQVKILKTAGFDYNPGQYVKICIPSISIFQWHPISISSSPFQPFVTLHIRKRGNWTSRLHDIAKKKTKVKILLEGPYGSSSLDFTSGDRYSMVMLVSAGIGVTPMQSIAHQLMYEHEWGDRELKKLSFIWTARDAKVIEIMDNIMSRSIHTTTVDMEYCIPNIASDNVDKETRPHASFLMNEAMSVLPITVGAMSEEVDENSLDSIEDFIARLDVVEWEGDDEELDESCADVDVESGCRSSKDSKPIPITLNSVASSYEDDTKMNPSSNDNDNGILDLQCYLTSKERILPGLTGHSFVHTCRPDMKQIFLKMRKEAMELNEKRVAVCICAPPRFVHICRNACIKYSNRHVRFDFHSEAFD